MKPQIFNFCLPVCQYYQPEGRRGGICQQLGAKQLESLQLLSLHPLGRSARNDHEADSAPVLSDVRPLEGD